VGGGVDEGEEGEAGGEDDEEDAAVARRRRDLVAAAHRLHAACRSDSVTRESMERAAEQGTLN
jgi:hypothetical protein